MVSGRGGKREYGRGGGVDNIFYSLLFIKRVCLEKEQAEKIVAADVEGKMGERKRVESILGRMFGLQSRPGECADRVCLCHSGASVTH